MKKKKVTSFYSCATDLKDEAIEFIMKHASGAPNGRIVFPNTIKDVIYFSTSNGVMEDSIAAIDVDGSVYFGYDWLEYANDYDFDDDPDSKVCAYMDLTNIDWMALCEIADMLGGYDMFSCRMKGIKMDAEGVLRTLNRDTKVDDLSIAMQVDDDFEEVPIVLVSSDDFTIGCSYKDVNTRRTYDELMTDDFLSLVDEINEKLFGAKK